MHFSPTDGSVATGGTEEAVSPGPGTCGGPRVHLSRAGFRPQGALGKIPVWGPPSSNNSEHWDPSNNHCSLLGAAVEWHWASSCCVEDGWDVWVAPVGPHRSDVGVQSGNAGGSAT